MSNQDDWQEELNEIKDGMGCTEIWEKLCEKREEQEESDEQKSDITPPAVD